MRETLITSIRGREILDSRGRPTVEADVVLADGTVGRASVPSGASTGRHEAVELRDGDPRRYRGLGVRTAVASIDVDIRTAVVGLDAADQHALDRRLVELDGSPGKRRLGANALLAVSLAACRAAAESRRIPLYRHIADLAGVEQPMLPVPMVNMISGGLHAGAQIDIQDVLVIPTHADSFAEALEQACAVHSTLGDRVRASGNQPLVADEGGWAPRLSRNEDALAWVAEAMESSNVEGVPAIDIASTHFFSSEDGMYRLRADDRVLDAAGMVKLLTHWTETYRVASLEDGTAEDDWDGWTLLTETLGSRVQILGDDLFTTNPVRLKRGIEGGIANAVLVKPNQIGTLWETLEVIRLAKTAGYRTVVSARSGETEDAFLADLAVGSAAGQIKVGSVTRSSRLSKWNQLLRIEEEIGIEWYPGFAAVERPGGTS